MSMKNSNYIIGKRTRNLPICRAVPQPTALHRASFEIKYHMQFLRLEYSKLEKQVKKFHQMTRLLGVHTVDV